MREMKYYDSESHVGKRRGALMFLSVLSLILSGVAVLISLLYGRRQSVLAQQANALSVLIGLVQEFRSPEFVVHRDFIDHQMTNYASCPLSSLPDDARSHARAVTQLFDNVGILVSFGLLDERMALSFLGDSAVRHWHSLEPYIRAERVRRNQEYQEFFEDFAVRAIVQPPSLIRAGLRLREMSIGTYEEPQSP